MTKAHQKKITENKRPLRKRSLSKDLALSLILLLILFEGVLLAYVYSRQSRFLLQELEKKADDYVEKLSEVLVVPLWDYDDEQIGKIGMSFLQSNVIDEVHIKDVGGKTLFRATGRQGVQGLLSRSVAIAHKDQIIGHADLIFSLGAINEELAWLRNSIVLILVISLVVIFVTARILLRVFMRKPLNILQNGIDRVARGDYAYEFDEIHHLELTGIARRIKEMAGDIQARERSLQVINQELQTEITVRKHAEEKIRESEEKLRKAQKMEAIGTLAGGVAHDLNNVLSSLISYPELILMDLPPDSPLRSSVLAIKKSGEKAASIVQDMLTLARRGVAVSEVVNLNDIITDYLKSPEYEKLKQIHPGVTLEVSLEPDLLGIAGSPVHLSKTVMNLVSNAAEALVESGMVSISSENRYIDQPISGYDDIEEGDYVTLTVSDTGIGIAAQDIERIFEPFYTKKAMGRSGTGLGMAVVWGTVKDHKGYIDVQSTEGKGTKFFIYLPACMQPSARKVSRRSIEDFRGQGEFLLIVDDVRVQREIAAEILTKLGYRVDAVASGEAAVDYLKSRTADLLVLDMIMDPGMDGLATYKQILQYHPAQKAIIASGFSESERVKEAQKLGAGAYVKKPYLMEKLAIAVKEELGK
ncbi:MAG: ATP-binding protein [Desulfobacteraceae bacterium]|nr:ATP-binding protein [Desulfobacteraceae bacterium]